jgi:hypothetical protein
MAGARRQIFMAFAVLVAGQQSSVFQRSGGDGSFCHQQRHQLFSEPRGGKMYCAFRGTEVLSLEYFSLLFIFLAYAVVESKILVSFLYILDHIFFNFAIAIRTYFQKVGDPKDIAPSMAVGFTINHIAAVFCRP